MQRKRLQRHSNERHKIGRVLGCFERTFGVDILCSLFLEVYTLCTDPGVNHFDPNLGLAIDLIGPRYRMGPRYRIGPRHRIWPQHRIGPRHRIRQTSDLCLGYTCTSDRSSNSDIFSSRLAHLFQIMSNIKLPIPGRDQPCPYPGHGQPFPPRSRSTVPTQVTVNRSHPGHGQPFPPRSRSTSLFRGQGQPAQFPVTVNLPIQDQGHPAYHRSWSPKPITGSSPLLHGTVNVLIPDPVSGSFVGNA